MFAHGLNPHYFANPPGFTYLLHFLFAISVAEHFDRRQLAARSEQIARFAE